MTNHNYKIAKLLSSEIKVTGIGSVPDTDEERICEFILDTCPDIPFCPQLYRVDARENMFLQFSENLPCLVPDFEKNYIYYDKSVDKEKKIAEFFDYIAYNCYDYFKISPDYFKCFNLLLEKSMHRPNKFIKSQVVGPITFLASVQGENGQALIHDDNLSDAIICGLGMKGLWQAKEIEKIDKTPIIFYDEPYLSSLGSAYSPLTKDRASSIINNLINFIKERNDILIGIHCCGNTDWEMILQTNIDILSFDSYGFSKYFVLYPEKIQSFLERGSLIFYGAVPTSEYNERITLDIVSKKFNELLDTLERKGIKKKLIIGKAVFTPSCGMGLLKEEVSSHILELTRALALKISGSSI